MYKKYLPNTVIRFLSLVVLLIGGWRNSPTIIDFFYNLIFVAVLYSLSIFLYSKLKKNKEGKTENFTEKKVVDKYYQEKKEAGLFESETIQEGEKGYVAKFFGLAFLLVVGLILIVAIWS